MAWTEQLASGRYRGGYLQGTFAHKAEALRKASVKEDEQRQPGAVDDRAGRITWEAWFPLWLDAHTVAESTETEYRSIAKNHVIPYLGHKELGDLTLHVGNTWTKRLTKEGRSPYTVRVAVQMVTASLNGAVGTRLKVNPFKGLKWPDLPRGVERFLTPAEVEAIAFHMETELNKAIVWTAVSTGMRAGEIGGLHVRRLDLERNVIAVVEAYDQKHKVIKALPKDKEERYVPIPSDVADMLASVVDGKSRRGICGYPHLTGRCPGGELVFVGPRQSPFQSTAWGRGPWAKALKKADIEGRVRVHDMRHTFASWLIQQGVSFAELAEVMGHSSWEVSKTYAHLADKKYDSVRTAITSKMAAARGAERGAEGDIAPRSDATPGDVEHAV
jgi:integrase